MRWGHTKEDVIWKYTQEEVFRLFEAIARKESTEFYAEAVRLHFVGMCTKPVASKKHGSDMRSDWKKYIKKLHPDNLKEKAKAKKNPLMGIMNDPKSKVVIVED